jgi:hypothetical protein
MMGISKSKNYLNYFARFHKWFNIKVPFAKVKAILECNHEKKIIGKQ